MRFIEAIETYNNPLGLCAISAKDEIIIAYPSKIKGYLRINNHDANISMEVKAHESPLTTIEMSFDGKMCATTSDKGTLIRIFRTSEAKMIQELRRGTEKAEIQRWATHLS